MKLEVSSRSDVGRVRELNEDSLGMYHPTDAQERAHKGELFLVADGMGGHLSGEVASRLAVESVVRFYTAWRGDDVRAGLVSAVQQANAQIRARGGEQSSALRMGTTLVGALLRGNELHVVNVGDSRAYRVRNGRIEQLSRDHSIVAEQVARGLIDAEKARYLPRNRITRALGHRETVEVDHFLHTLQVGDVIVLCTDGLTGQVQDAEIATLVTQYSPEEATARLIELANQRGGPDNISVIVVRVGPDTLQPPTLAARPQPAWKKHIWLWPFVLVALTALLLAALLALALLALSKPGLPSAAPVARSIQIPTDFARECSSQATTIEASPSRLGGLSVDEPISRGVRHVRRTTDHFFPGQRRRQGA
jgi:protein phosphatase